MGAAPSIVTSSGAARLTRKRSAAKAFT